MDLADRQTQRTKGVLCTSAAVVVERTFAWLGRCRRMSKDYEELPENSEAMIQVAMINLMLRRLATET